MYSSLLSLSFFLLGVAAGAQPLSSPDRNGEALRNFYLSLHVEQRWLAGTHVNWETGEADKPDATSGTHTHCSAFVASACKQLGIYMLRPPEHKQILLANAQYDWLNGDEARQRGWQPISGDSAYRVAQEKANEGYVVVAVCQNPDSHKPGHSALVMPANATIKSLRKEGPAVIMAGTHNHDVISLKEGFHSHLTGWPENSVLFYFNTQPPVFR